MDRVGTTSQASASVLPESDARTRRRTSAPSARAAPSGSASWGPRSGITAWPRPASVPARAVSMGSRSPSAPGERTAKAIFPGARPCSARAARSAAARPITPPDGSTEAAARRA
ncbi:MAG: hypothetical protein A2V77_24465 [Anaeromyxobacter sp. RBG_16_69_14]|nr:MAG: hypothetical protein A2V77_24465 [Anaeromyxobacter sp. RBG_16_69_14]